MKEKYKNWLCKSQRWKIRTMRDLLNKVPMRTSWKSTNKGPVEWVYKLRGSWKGDYLNGEEWILQSDLTSNNWMKWGFGALQFWVRVHTIGFLKVCFKHCCNFAAINVSLLPQENIIAKKRSSENLIFPDFIWLAPTALHCAATYFTFTFCLTFPAN